MAWSGRKVQQARALLADRTEWPTPCARGCGKTLDRTPERQWALGHIAPRWERPDLTWEPNNWQVECRPCSDASGQAEALAKAHAAGAKSVYNGGFPDGDDPRTPRRRWRTSSDRTASAASTTCVQS